MSQASTYVAQPTTNWVNHSQLLDENFTLKDMHYGQEAPEIKEEEVFLNQSLHLVSPRPLPARTPRLQILTKRESHLTFRHPILRTERDLGISVIYPMNKQANKQIEWVTLTSNIYREAGLLRLCEQKELTWVLLRGELGLTFEANCSHSDGQGKFDQNLSDKMFVNEGKNEMSMIYYWQK